MADNHPLFIKDNRYYYVAEELYCDKCSKEIHKIFAHCCLFNNKWTYKFNYCLDCYKEAKQIGVVEVHIPCSLISTRPSLSKPVVYNRVVLSQGRYKDVFEAGIRYESGVEVIDKTIHSLKESWGGAEIGADVSELIGEKDSSIKTEEEARKALTHEV